MYVVATAGHVDHGKSALVRALTGTDPDRLAEEKRRGLTVDLGFAATELPDGRPVGFVDVPGHRRFLANTLAGIATAPAVLFVVAADRGWQPQSAEHLAAVDAFGVRAGALVVTRADLADPAPMLAEVRDRVAGTGLGDAPALAVSARTGAGLGELRALLATLAAGVPATDPHAPVRLWLDRSFTVCGAGTVVTGTLTQGSLSVGDALELAPDGRPVAVRGLQVFGTDRERVRAPARVAVNLRRVATEEVRRGHALVTPGRWWRTETVDVRIADGTQARALPSEPLVHCGTALTGARVRPLGGPFARLRLHNPLDLHVGDRLLLRDPGSRRLTGARILDVAPPPLTRRGAAAARARAFADLPADGADATVHLRLRGAAPAADLTAMGLPAPPDAVPAGEWLLDAAHARRLHATLLAEVRTSARAHPEAPGLPLATAARRLRLPSPDLVRAAALSPDGALVVRDGQVHLAGDDRRLPPAAAAAAIRLTEARSAARTPFHVPAQPELDALGVTPQLLAVLVRHGVLERYGTAHLPVGSDRRAAAALREAAPRPFTVGECCRTLAVSRRIAIPLLEQLDRAGLTRRDADGRRLVQDEKAAVGDT